MGVQKVKGLHHTASYELGRLVIEVLSLRHDRPDVAAHAGLHQEVHILLVAVGAIESSEEYGWDRVIIPNLG